MSNRIGYIRKNRQELRTDIQEKALFDRKCNEIYVDLITNNSSESFDQPELQKLLKNLKNNDFLIVCKLNRLGCSIKQILETCKYIHERGAHIMSIEEELDSSTAKGEEILSTIISLLDVDENILPAEYENPPVEESVYQNVYKNILNYDRIPEEIYDCLPNLIMILKPSEIASLAKISYSTFMLKVKRTTIGKTKMQFNNREKICINETVKRIGFYLLEIEIPYEKNNLKVCETQDKINEALKYVQPKYFYENIFQKDSKWFSRRMKSNQSCDKHYYFSSNDIEDMNKGIQSLAYSLINIEFII